MRFSQLVFPFPNPPTYNQDRLVGELLYVPKDFSDCPEKYVEIAAQTPSSNSSIMQNIAESNKARVLQDIDENRLKGRVPELDNLSVQIPDSTQYKQPRGNSVTELKN